MFCSYILLSYINFNSLALLLLPVSFAVLLKTQYIIERLSTLITNIGYRLENKKKKISLEVKNKLVINIGYLIMEGHMLLQVGLVNKT